MEEGKVVWEDYVKKIEIVEEMVEEEEENYKEEKVKEIES